MNAGNRTISEELEKAQALVTLWSYLRDKNLQERTVSPQAALGPLQLASADLFNSLALPFPPVPPGGGALPPRCGNCHSSSRAKFDAFDSPPTIMPELPLPGLPLPQAGMPQAGIPLQPKSPSPSPPKKYKSVDSEKRRRNRLNSKFAELRSLLPHELHRGQKLTKEETLRIAVEYIRRCQQIQKLNKSTQLDQ